MPARTAHLSRALARCVTASLALLLAYGGVAGAQVPVMHDMPSLGLPPGEVVDLRVGPAGGTFAVVRTAGEHSLHVYDGTAWSVCHRLGAGEMLVPTVNGELVLLSHGELYTYRWRFRAPPRRISLGRLPQGEFVALAVRVPSETAAPDQSLHSGATLVVETGSGVFACTDGHCERHTTTPRQLLGATHADIYLLDGDGVVSRFGAASHPIGQLPAAARNPDPIPTDNLSEVVFRQDDILWALGTDGCLREVARVDPTSKLMVVGGWLLRFRSGDAVEATPLDGALAWRQVFRTDAHTNTRARLPRGPVLAFRVSDRVVVRSQFGLSSVEPLPTAGLDVGLARGRSAVVGLYDGGLITGQNDAVATWTFELLGRSALRQSFPTHENLMRTSVPTAVGEWRGAPVVGTSDARVLELRPGAPPRELVNVREFGASVTDLRHIGQALWGVFDVGVERHGGLFRVDPDGSPELYGDTTGLRAPVSCVREGADGTPIVSTATGDSPLHRYFAAQNLWLPLRGAIARRPVEGHLIIHEIAPAGDSAIYLATSRGLYAWTESAGYNRVPLPAGLLYADIRSVLADRGGIWFAAEGRGVYFFAASGLRAYEGDGHWDAASFRPRGLVALPDGSVAILDGAKLVAIERPNLGRGLVAPGIAFTNAPGDDHATFAHSDRQIAWQEGDSLYIHYALPGEVTADLVADFVLDGEALQPHRTKPGLAVFAPLPPGDYEFAVRVMAPHRGHSAKMLRQPIRVLRHWWTTPSGYLIVFFLVASAIGLGAYVYGVQQRTHARALERLVVERTADLALARQLAERASEAKTSFLANMSHELRTPLNAVLGMTDLLVAGDLRPEQAEYVRAIRRGGSVLNGIVADILDFAQIDNGAIRNRAEVFELATSLHELATRFAERAADAGLGFAYALDVPPVVKADADKLGSILAHLLANAVKFTPGGHIRLEARYVAPPESECGELTLVVADTGIGIDDADLARIFEVFEQGDNSNTRRFGGTGLGLAIVRTYVECLGGAVTVASTLGAGATFTVRLPVESAPSILAERNSESLRPAHEAPAALLCGGPDFLRAQLATEFRGEVTFEAAVSPKGYAQAYLPPAEARDVLVFALTHLEGLVAFRQNPFTVAHRAAGRPVVILGLHRDLLALSLEPGEESLAYPIHPDDLPRLPLVWSALGADAGQYVRPESAPASERPADDPDAGRTPTLTATNRQHALSQSSPHDRKPEPAAPAVDEPAAHTRRAVANAPGDDAERAAAEPPAASSGGATAPPANGTPGERIPDLTPATGVKPVDASPSDAPLASAAAAGTPASKPSAFFDLASEHPLRILVAEDNAMNKTLILTVLAKFGYRADWAEDGRVAVDRAAAQPYDLILMDVHMPNLDGLEATRELRARFPERPVTICALTANASEDGRADCLAAGMDAFMAKPLQIPRLLAQLRATVPLAHRMREGQPPGDDQSTDRPHSTSSASLASRG